jgi:hypothetical protein
MTRLRAEVTRSVPADQARAVLLRLDRAEAALAAGRTFQALYDIEPAWETAAIARFVASAADVTTPEAFDARWQAVGPPGTDAGDTRALPLVVEAIAASAGLRGPVTYRASRPYAVDSDLKSGLYYLGESQVLGQFAAFARALPWAPAGDRPALRPLGAEIDALEREVTTAYERMARADHQAYMLASVTLKRARAANDAGQHSAALLEYLFARLRFGPLRGSAPAGLTPDRVQALRARLAGRTDHTVAQLFVDLAEAWSTGTDQALRRSAALVADEVIPAYFAALGPPVTSTTEAAEAAVTITLVRWPYT